MTVFNFVVASLGGLAIPFGGRASIGRPADALGQGAPEQALRLSVIGNGGEVVGCDDCQVHVFCRRCITRNCGRRKFAEISGGEEWSCFTCRPDQIYQQRSQMAALARVSAHGKKVGRKAATPRGQERVTAGDRCTMLDR